MLGITIRNFKKQELERKRGLRSSKTCDGKIEHRIDEKDIRPDIAQKLRLRHSSDIIHAIAMSATPSALTKIPIKHKQFWLYRILLGGMDDDTLDKDRKNRLFIDLLNLLFDMGWPKKVVLEKLTADSYKLKLRREYIETKKKGNESRPRSNYPKLRLRPFNDVLNERLYKVFRSDGFRQIKLKLGLDKVS
jgi:hypothetical protein